MFIDDKQNFFIVLMAHQLRLKQKNLWWPLIQDLYLLLIFKFKNFNNDSCGLYYMLIIYFLSGLKFEGIVLNLINDGP